MIPKQLKKYAFNRVLYKTKKPFEKDWTNKPYTYEEISEYFPSENYGVMTGVKQLGVLDDDTDKRQLIKTYKQHFPNTFRVRDHFYIKLLNWDGNKIIFFDDKGKHMGELQGKGQMVVGCGSVHPSGEVYDLRNNIPIIEIEFKKFKEVFSKYIKKIKPVEKRVQSLTSYSGEDIKQIPISNVISLGALNDVGGSCYQGCHPQHGSENGMNFRVDTEKNIWHCFRCRSGGSTPELIGVMEGIISCSQAGKNCFTKGQGQEVIRVAREKYGLKSPLVEEMKPQGLALSLNIKDVAEKHNITKCPKCLVSYKFEERMGWYHCPICEERGGIRKLVIKALSIQNEIRNTKKTTKSQI